MTEEIKTAVNGKAEGKKKTRGRKKNYKNVEKKNVEKEIQNKEEVVNNGNEKTVEIVENHKNTNRKMQKGKADKKKGFDFKPETIKIIPLGGLHEVGKNITVFEYDNEMIIVDCGIAFPEDEMLGVDLVIPDVTYLERNKEKIKGMVITHGHEDHIGSIPYFLKQINVPIYATRLTCGLIKNKLEEHKLLRSTKLVEVKQGQTITLGKFRVEFIRSSHSIPDSVALAITTKAGTIVHTGDFKIDYTPIDGQLMDFNRLAEIGNNGVLALMSDSTNAERKGYTMSEKNCSCNICIQCSSSTTNCKFCCSS